jgi:hypothetical protein
MNLLFCAAPCNVYDFLTMEAYPNAFTTFPPKVPDVPDYTACVNNNVHPMVHAMHARDKKTQADIVTMNTALADVFLEAMSSQVRASFQKWRLCEPNIIFVKLFLWFINQYSKTTAKDCKANWQCMATIGTPPTGSMPSFSTSSPELHTPAVRGSR